MKRKCYRCREMPISKNPLEQYCKACLPPEGGTFWNNRVMLGEGYAAVVEVHYDEKGYVEGWGSPKALVGNDWADLEAEFERVREMFLGNNSAALSHRQYALHEKELEAEIKKAGKGE